MKLKPTKGQLDFLNWEFGVFFHFGIRSFYPATSIGTALLGETIGHKLICPKLTVEILDSDGEHKITEIKGYFTK